MDFSSTDLKNFDLLEKYIKVYGFEEEDEKFAISALRNPLIDNEYKKLLGDDLRKRWKITGKNQTVNDAGWSYFKKYFAHYESMDIGYEEYKTNKKLVGKNGMKIKKVMADWYINNFSSFLRDLKPEIGILANYDVDDITSKKNTLLIDKYIVKAFELIGTKKVPNSELELVLSCNFADWFLCSTAEDWQSCLCLDGGAYWTGIMELIGDRNRAFLYVTNGKRKNWHGIEVDSVISRSWVLLSRKNEKKVVRFYPTDFLDINEIRKITEDNSFASTANEKTSKNEIVPIKFKKGGIWTTIFNDGCGLDKSIFSNTGKLFWDFSRSRASDTVSVPQKLTNESVQIGVNRTLHSPHDYLTKGKLINADVVANICPSCGKILRTSENVISVGNDRYCSECASKVLAKCTKCGTWEEKSKIKIYIINGKPMKICPNCLTNTYECASCGTRHFKDSGSISISDGRFVCPNCKSKIAKCVDCEEDALKSELIKHKSTLVCKKCFKTNKSKYRGFKACLICNTSHQEDDLTYDVNGNGTCDKCIDELSRNDNRLMRFNFIDYAIKEE